ncbi:MAG: mycothiol system anti-sigma-R factor [Acidimicrobiales bacterium]
METNSNRDDLDCREALHRIYHFLDGELTAERRSQIEAHLNCCSPCLDMFGFEAELRKVVACKCQEAVPDELREKIAASIHHEHDRMAT